jgi:carbamate kinase
MIGYVLEQGLRNELPDRAVATLLTQVVVDAADPAFDHPTKPVGPVYSEAEAARVERERGWTVARDGNSFRRVVPSPEPREVVELDTIRLLVDNGVLVICSGGGGIPVVRDANDALRGVEAVIDKDLSAALLAEQLEADALLLLTDVSAVQLDWGTTSARPIRLANPSMLRTLDLAPGSMGPKAEAACRFVEETNGVAAIGALEDAERVLDGTAGTRVSQPGVERPEVPALARAC